MTTSAKVWTSVAVFAVAVAVYYPFSPSGSQHINMRKAEDHITAIRPQISSNPAFNEVRLWPFTDLGGSLLVAGTVASESEVEALRALVDASNPPVAVAFRVIVLPPPTTQPTPQEPAQ